MNLLDRLFSYHNTKCKTIERLHSSLAGADFRGNGNVPRGEAEGNIEVEGKQNSLFPEGPVIKCFVTPPDSKIEKAPKKNSLLGAIAYTGCARKIERLPKATCSIEK